MAFRWEAGDDDAAAAARYIRTELVRASPHDWWTAFETEGFLAIAAGATRGGLRTYPVGRRGGVILGRLFRRGADDRHEAQAGPLDDGERAACLATQGRHLFDSHWGRYVAFLVDPESCRLFVLRDPSGAFPCFVTGYRQVEIYFSDMQDVGRSPDLRFTPDWSFVRTNILLPNYQKTTTGLSEVGEVLPAESVEIGPDGRRSRFLWDPADYAAAAEPEAIETMASRLRSAVSGAIQAQVAGYDRILHSLGGLDSSIALACMVAAPDRPEISCVTHFTRSPRGDERSYTRAMAEHARVPLIEAELRAERADLTRVFRSNLLARPPGFFDCLGLNDHVVGAVASTGAEVVATGVGGDQIFYQPAFNLSALDHVRAHGFGGASIPVGLDAARYGRTTLAATLRDMLRERLRPAPCFGYVHDLLLDRRKFPFVDYELLAAGGLETQLHSLLRPADDMPKGKYLHILISALFSLEHYDHWDTGYAAERLRLYFCQPIIEACLRIPTWQLTYRGIDRGLARKAFAADLPRRVAARTSKNGPDDFYADLLRLNLPLIREVLLDGALLRERVLKRSTLERALDPAAFEATVNPLQLLRYFATEAWLGRWPRS